MQGRLIRETALRPVDDNYLTMFPPAFAASSLMHEREIPSALKAHLHHVMPQPTTLANISRTQPNPANMRRRIP